MTARPPSWPFPNRHFDAELGRSHLRAYLDQLVYAEECGFDWVGIGEDHMTAYSLTPNPSLILAALSQRTERVKLAVLGFPLPLLNPLRVAEECAMLDVMSGGRLVIGFVRGVPQNYAAYNVDPDESRERFEEAHALIVKAWTAEATFAWRGKFYEYPTISLWPLPLQKPHPPLIFSANSPTSARLAARHRTMVGSIHLYSRDALATVRTSMDAYREEAAKVGWTPGAEQFLIGLQTCIAETDEQARQVLDPALEYQYRVLSGTYDAEKRRIAQTKPGYGFTPVEESPPSLEERLAQRTVLCGSPASVVRQIEELRSYLGVGVVSMHFQVGNMRDRDVRDGLRLFSSGVRPHFATEAQ